MSSSPLHSSTPTSARSARRGNSGSGSSFTGTFSRSRSSFHGKNLSMDEGSALSDLNRKVCVCACVCLLCAFVCSWCR